MAIEITMPKMGLSMVTGTVAKWLKNEGDAIQQGEAVLEVMTDKLTNTVDAPADGVLLRIVAQEAEELEVGAVLGFVGAAGESLPDSDEGHPAAAANSAGGASAAQTAGAVQTAVLKDGKIKCSPLARKIAGEAGLELEGLSGTGPGGRIVRADVEKALKARAAKAGAEAPENAAAPVVCPSKASDRYTVLPYAGMRRAIGANMVRSRDTAVKVDYHGRADISRLLALRQTINEALPERLSITDLLVRIAAVALKKQPGINAALAGDEIRLYQDVHIGVAVAVPSGLIVPVVRNADSKAVSQISREIKELSRRARENRLTEEEFRGGTFTISNLGAYRSVEFFTPVINQPESAILGVGNTVETPVAVNGEVVIRPLLGLSLVCDHRVIDGAPAAEFLALLIELIENPYQALV